MYTKERVHVKREQTKNRKKFVLRKTDARGAARIAHAQKRPATARFSMSAAPRDPSIARSVCAVGLRQQDNCRAAQPRGQTRATITRGSRAGARGVRAVSQGGSARREWKTEP
jgi:hypothetical protein